MTMRTGDSGGRAALAAVCNAIDWINSVIGIVVGTSIVFVTIAVMWEIIGRGLFGSPTIWANETTIYLSAMTYLIAGGYALLHDRHVRIDVIYANLSVPTQARLDAGTLIFTLLYAGALVWLGGRDFLGAWAIGETTGTPWNPPVWPVKAAIPLAGFLVFLQAISNTLRSTGIAPPRIVS